MATIKIYPDFRRAKQDGSSQIMLVLCHRNRQKYIGLGMHCSPGQWDADAGRVNSSNRHHRQINLRIAQCGTAAQAALLALPRSASIAQAAEAVKAAMFGEPETEEPERRTLAQAARLFMATKTERSTVESYECAIKHIERHGDVALDEMTAGWLDSLDKSMAKTARSANARAIYMRNIRAVVNFAIDEGWTQNYPFRKYRIKTVKTAKRSMPADAMRRLLTMEVDEWQEQYRDFFALSFLLIGTNAKDLMSLPAGADSSGRIEFNRAKTKKLYSIKVEPEAQELIDKYRGEGHMLRMLDGREDHKQYVRQCNHALRAIGTGSRQGRRGDGEPAFPGITTYWARHSWATIAASLDIPKETIAAALGHDMGNPTTAIYINFAQGKVDEANRRVIDHVLGK